MRPPVNYEVRQALARAKDCLNSAEYDLKGNFFLATANRAYYTCYYCITALLYTVDVEAKTHEGTHRKFHEHFIKSGIFPTDLGSAVGILFDRRQVADYNLEGDITSDEATDSVEKAKHFYQEVVEYLVDWTIEDSPSN